VTVDGAEDGASNRGDPRSIDRLFEVLYRDLHVMAHRHLHPGSGAPPALNTTVLVHEAYLRLANAEKSTIVDGRQLLAYAAHVMRSVIVDMMRSENAEKRGSGQASLTLDTGISDAVPASADEALKVNDALIELNCIDTVLVQIVEMRYFAGLTEEEIAETMQMSTRTVRRHWHKARIFLRENLAAER
jgi:RNA polymerase sigma factor (TIGR02999 family)